MFKIFRKIRLLLINENKHRKYLVYGVGEILLITVGILLALQVNNWNESRKDDVVELKILYGLNSDLNKDILKMEYMISADSTINVDNLQLLQILKDPSSEYQKSMDKLFGYHNRNAFFFPQKMAYETLKSKGLEIIKNDELRSKIVNLYDYEYDVIRMFLDVKKELYYNSNSIVLKYLETNPNDITSKKPYDFQELKNNNEFINYLSHICGEQNAALYFYRDVRYKLKLVREEVEKEIIIKTE